MTRTKTDAIDPRTDAVILAYTGGPLALGVPGRDLNGNDLARIARVWALTESGGQPVEVGPAEFVAVRDALLAGGAFVVAPTDQTPVAPAPAEA